MDVSAKTNERITSALSPVFKGVQKARNLYQQTKAVAGIGDEAVEAGKSVGANTKQLNDSQKSAPTSPAPQNQKVLGSYKKGGKVKKTGVYKLHKGEKVLNRKQTKKFQKKGMKAVLAGKA